jgi:predicted NBD/HSP70 family sugar kinase
MKLVFDLGATKTRMALIGSEKLEAVVESTTDSTAGGFARFLGLMEQLAGGQQLEAIVGGVAGQLEGERGELVLATNLPQWLGVGFKAGIHKSFDCPVYVSNDVVIGGLGEAHTGSGITSGIMAYVTISTGVNGVRIVDGAVDTSIVRYEIGKQLIAEDRGQAISWESLVGGAAMHDRIGREPKQVRSEKVWRGEERHVAVGIYNTLLHWSPELVVCGGSMMRDIDLEVVSRELQGLPKVGLDWPRLSRAKLGALAGLHGAVVWARQLGL